MLVVDDLLIRPFMFMLEALHSMAIEEMYDVEGLRDELKENQLLYEVGERSAEEYEERKSIIEAQLRIAEDARAKLQHKQIQVTTR